MEVHEVKVKTEMVTSETEREDCCGFVVELSEVRTLGSNWSRSCQTRQTLHVDG